MKYDDDELAEAALLLAHEDAEHPMPAHLEKKILARGRDVSSEIRFSTTKAAAVEIEAPIPLPRPRRSPLRTWGAWLAAAALVAVTVYQWRAHDLQREMPTAATQAYPSSLTVRGADGVAVADVRWNDGSREGRIDVVALPANAPGERYQLWLSTGDAASAIEVGAFTCAGECRTRAFALREPPGLGRVARAWITRGPVSEATPPTSRDLVVGEGSNAPR
jgi:hypothetical protein